MEGGKLHPDIFRAYDIRGRYPDEVNEELARRLASRLAAHLGGGRFIIGHDTRKGSDSLADAAIEGAKTAGAHVIDVGDVSTPQFQWAARSLDTTGGMMVTASHLPEPQNGFKAVAKQGDSLDVLGGDRLRQIADLPEPESAPGTVEREDVAAGYAAAVAYAAKWSGGAALRVSIDAPASVQQVLQRLGPVAPSDDFGAKFDRDGDRIVFYAAGAPIPADDIFLLLAENLHLAPLVFDLRFSRSVSEHLDENRIPYAVSRVGRLAMSQAMRERGAALGAEISGHYYWGAMGGLECPELTLLQVLKLCEGSGERLMDLVRTYGRYGKSKEIDIPISDRKHAARIIERMQQRFAGCGMDRFDGLTVDCWNGYLSVPPEDGFWFNIRPSNTEGVMRLVVESKQKALLDRRVQEVRGLAQ